ncbi:nicotinate-nucleotide pyrophosphorylase [carboxylating], chloroplastic-like [Hordeum vulgare subsp. vulgare]|uniref:nicotinate-nucleotide pyrophosphorylase [carboxylating], chloroplastic-like n=1 Tax=Hordeum vulgare subsp. vulgare TaxID=112509 RepID=UPI001D1A580C|nr:nicotinate-nucleotide pyrophosphorylase [carboxylating], chloroplastic-like [Hordeum vulgare subsp. vulgare]
MDIIFDHALIVHPHVVSRLSPRLPASSRSPRSPTSPRSQRLLPVAPLARPAPVRPAPSPRPPAPPARPAPRAPCPCRPLAPPVPPPRPARPRRQLALHPVRPAHAVRLPRSPLHLSRPVGASSCPSCSSPRLVRPHLRTASTGVSSSPSRSGPPHLRPPPQVPFLSGHLLSPSRGCAQSIIVAERVVLNFMQRMSGIATMTKAMADAARPACILETRKTAPGLRLVDKWAVLIGGGKNHTLGLFDMVMIKDNHISVAGGITNAMTSVDQFLVKENPRVPVEVETRTLEEVRDLLKYTDENKTSLTRIMLDNMVVPLPNGDLDVSMLKDAVQLINGRFETQASGNVTIDTVKKIGETRVTYISRHENTFIIPLTDSSSKFSFSLF